MKCSIHLVKLVQKISVEQKCENYHNNEAFDEIGDRSGELCFLLQSMYCSVWKAISVRLKSNDVFMVNA